MPTTQEISRFQQKQGFQKEQRYFTPPPVLPSLFSKSTGNQQSTYTWWKGEGFQPMQLHKLLKTSETAFVELLEMIISTGFYYRIKNLMSWYYLHKTPSRLLSFIAAFPKNRSSCIFTCISSKKIPVNCAFALHYVKLKSTTAQSLSKDCLKILYRNSA